MRNHILLFSILLVCNSFAQVSTVERKEFDLYDGYYNEKIYEFQEKGFLMLSESKTKNGVTTWKYSQFNSDLDNTGEQTIEIKKGLIFDENYKDDDGIYTLFKSRRGEYKIVSYNFEEDDFNEVDGELKKGMSIKRMRVVDDYAYFVANYKKEPYLLRVDLKTGEEDLSPIEIEGFKSKKLGVRNMQLLEETKEIFLIISTPLPQKKTATYIIQIDASGETQEAFNYSEGFEEKIISASTSNISEGNYAIAGTYSSKLRNKSNGLYFSILSEGELEYISFYDFLDLDNFLNYMPERGQKKLEKKKKRKESKGRDFVISYNLAVHDIIAVDDGYLLLAEAFYPTYRTETYTTTTFVNGVSQTTTSTRQVFDGYQYTHAIMAKFDSEGEKEWDQSFEMWMAYKPFYPKKFINIAEQDKDQVKLVFASYDRIVSKSFSYDGEIIDDQTSEEIETDYEGDKVKRSFSNMSYWYDNYFIAYGTQKIKNREGEAEKKKRNVFFVNKIQY